MLKRLTLYSLYFVAIAFPLLLHLEKRTVRLWDESLFALRAMYLSETGKFLNNFNQFDQLPHHLNTKPIFGTLFQALSFKIFGYTELGLRFPMVIFSFLTVGLLLYAGKKILNNLWIGFASGLILITSQGYLMVHIARSGEHEVVIAFLMTLGLLSFFLYSKNLENANRKIFLWICVLSVVAAILTKLVIGLFFLPGFLLYLIHTKQLKSVLQDRSLYWGIAAALVMIVGYFFLIEHFNEGYLQRLWDYELVGRYTNAIETEKLPWYYYFHRLIDGKFLPWLVFMALAIIWLQQKWTASNRDLVLLSLYCVGTYLLIISFSGTKKFWYDASIYPIISLVAGIGLFEMYQYLKYQGEMNTKVGKGLFVGFIILLFVVPYSLVMNKVYLPKNGFEADKYGYLIRRMEKSHPDIKEFTIAINNFGASAAFYQNAYNLEKGYSIELARGANYKKGDYIICCIDNAFIPIDKKYTVDVIQVYDLCKLLQVSGEKEVESGN
jgi:4-amino-4-deoxy-L-arabinose transferase-like glycosyltransferase